MKNKKVISNVPDYIFSCRKCLHQLYVDKNEVYKLLGFECPECGEESERLWLFNGQGNFKDISN
jgi:predicted RNA-binding Zn-ribbon protein involved in translation (DUF1610 family)